MSRAKRHLLPLFFLFFLSPAQAAEKWWVTFRDKGPADRAQLADSTDWPVDATYLSAVAAEVRTITAKSNWLNGAAVVATGAQLDRLRSLDCIASVEPMLRSRWPLKRKQEQSCRSRQQLVELAKYQTERFHPEPFRQRRLDGRGLRIAVFDAGFPKVNTHPAFRHLRERNAIVATYDFVKRTEDVYAHHWHGTAVLSCIAGRMDSIPLGLATGAEFLLARTERAGSEPFSEEEHWLEAVEWAYAHGANIISSSLGYTNKRYFNDQMDGHTSLVARAANIAASKGMLVINAAGNEGTDDWHFIDTPADADSVLAIGGTEPTQDVHVGFSSYGPSSDGRLKPNLCAPARVTVAAGGGYREVAGTSFSTPLVAGFAACAWQAEYEQRNMELFRLLEQSGSLYPYYDYAHGYGVPQARRALGDTLAEPTFDFVVVNDEVKVILREQYSYPETERQLGYPVQRNLYYKISDRQGNIRTYTVMTAEEKEALHFYAGDLKDGDAVTVHFEGYTGTFDLQQDPETTPDK
jgi:hypothetical protein